MRRVVIGCVVFIVLIAAIYFDPGDITACKGHCWTQGTPVASPIFLASPSPEETPLPQDHTPTSAERCEIADGSVSLLGLAELDPESGRPLCLIDVALTPGDSSQSITDPGGVETYYVQAGTIEFSLDNDVNMGTVRFVPAPNAELPTLQQLPDGSYQATTGEQFTISAGGTVYIDDQDVKVAMEYANTGGEEAAVLISSAPPVVESAATPEP